MESMFLQLVGKTKKEAVHVDMGEKLPQLGLLEHVPDCVWPPPTSVTGMATKLKAATQIGRTSIFLNVEVKK